MEKAEQGADEIEGPEQPGKGNVGETVRQQLQISHPEKKDRRAVIRTRKRVAHKGAQRRESTEGLWERRDGARHNTWSGEISAGPKAYSSGNGSHSSTESPTKPT